MSTRNTDSQSLSKGCPRLRDDVNPNTATPLQTAGNRYTMGTVHGFHTGSEFSHRTCDRGTRDAITVGLPAPMVNPREKWWTSSFWKVKLLRVGSRCMYFGSFDDEWGLTGLISFSLRLLAQDEDFGISGVDWTVLLSRCTRVFIVRVCGTHQEVAS